jgi:hypothetical protein
LFVRAAPAPGPSVSTHPSATTSAPMPASHRRRDLPTMTAPRATTLRVAHVPRPEPRTRANNGSRIGSTRYGRDMMAIRNRGSEGASQGPPSGPRPASANAWPSLQRGT